MIDYIFQNSYNIATSAINSAKTAAHDLTRDGGAKSADDDFGGTEWKIRSTSAEVTGLQV